MAERTKLWFLQNFNLFRSLPPEAMERLSQKVLMETSQPKTILYFPEEPSNTIYFLKKGKVKITRISEDGRRTTLQLLGPGDIFGESAILGRDKRENVAEVLEDAVICTISKETLQELMDEVPELNRSIRKLIGFRLQRIQAQLEDLVFKTARERIEAFLRRFTKKFGRQMVDGWLVRPFLRHQEIAELTATTRQTVTAVLNELVAEEIIAYKRSYLLVKNQEWLEKES